MAILRNLRFRLRQGQHGPAGLVLLVLFLALALFQIEPFPTFFFVCAWYPFLLILDALVLRRRGGSLLTDRPLAFACLLGWSLPFWLVFEAANLRLQNWYYVNVPADPLAARLLLILSFATVLPGLIEMFDLLEAYGLFRKLRTPRFHAGAGLRAALVASGLLMLALALLFPGTCYPLIWGFLVLLLEPFNRRPGWRSLLRDLERGRPGRLLRLVVAGLLCGLYWEVMNMPARARWIYSIPFFEETLGVEMPPIGFLGFAPFALEAYAFVRALEILGLSVPFEPDGGGRPAIGIQAAVRLLVLPALAALFCVATIRGLERHTVDSTIARVDQLTSASRRQAAALELAGLGDLRTLLRAGRTEAGRRELAELLLSPPERVFELLVEAKLIELRGLGVENARMLMRAGIESVPELAERDPGELYRLLARRGEPAGPFLRRRLGLWIRAARRAGA